MQEYLPRIAIDTEHACNLAIAIQVDRVIAVKGSYFIADLDHEFVHPISYLRTTDISCFTFLPSVVKTYLSVCEPVLLEAVAIAVGWSTSNSSWMMASK